MPSSGGSYIGVDPGQKGGIAVVENNNVVFCTEMPSTERDIWEVFQEIREQTNGFNNLVAMIELVHSMPKQGVASSFKFGLNYGLVRMAIVASEIPFEEVSPQKWMKAMGINHQGMEKKEGKELLLKKAQQLFPKLPLWKEPRSKGRQLAVCDAILLAEYCQRKENGLL